MRGILEIDKTEFWVQDYNLYLEEKLNSKIL